MCTLLQLWAIRFANQSSLGVDGEWSSFPWPLQEINQQLQSQLEECRQAMLAKEEAEAVLQAEVRRLVAENEQHTSLQAQLTEASGESASLQVCPTQHAGLLPSTLEPVSSTRSS